MNGWLPATVVLVLGLVSVHGAWAGPPTDQLRAGVDRVMQVLKDPELKGEAQVDRRRAALGRIAGDMFDFGDMARRALGQHWDPRTPAERVEFVRLFTDLVQRVYLTKVDQHGAATAMTFRGETVDADHAVVQTTIPRDNGGKIPLDYRMQRTGDRWKIYDLSIDGISLVANYRAQFNRVIRTSSYAELVTRLESSRSDALFASPGSIDANAP